MDLRIRLKISTPGVADPVSVAPLDDTKCKGCGGLLRSVASGMECEACGEMHASSSVAEVSEDTVANNGYTILVPGSVEEVMKISQEAPHWDTSKQPYADFYFKRGIKFVLDSSAMPVAAWDGHRWIGLNDDTIKSGPIFDFIMSMDPDSGNDGIETTMQANIRASLHKSNKVCPECNEAFQPMVGGLKCPVCGCFASKQVAKTAAHKVPEIIKSFKGEFGAQITEESTKIDMLDSDYRFKDIHVKGPCQMKMYSFYFGSETDYVTILHMKGKNRLFYYSTIWGLSDEMEEKVTGWMKEHSVINSAYFKVQQGASDKFKAQIWKC